MKVFSVDAETDGLYGPTLAIGVSVREGGQEVAQFAARLARLDPKNFWVRDNVVPQIQHISQTFGDVMELEEAFWQFWLSHKEDAVAVAHCAAPVETGLFRRCVERDPETRMWQGPFPLHEIGTALALRGHDPTSVDGFLLARGHKPDGQHNPLEDARWAAVAFEALLRAETSDGGPTVQT